MRTHFALLALLFASTILPTVARGQTASAPRAVPYDYTSDWPEGRGFSVGNTVPDIPLVDLDGKEIRLSKFLGKRYVLYCWASW